MQDIAVFASVTLILAYVSRASLRRPGSHGFYRFFAWECMLALFVLNMHDWNDAACPAYQLVSGLLFATSLLLVLLGYGQLQLSGTPDPGRHDGPMLGFEKTTTLVTSGIYRYIRHPIYSSLLFLCWGFFFKQPTLAGSLLAILASGLLVATARTEERENIHYFGDQYRSYMKKTRMFLPFIV